MKMKYANKFMVVPYVPQIENEDEKFIVGLHEELQNIINSQLKAHDKVKQYNSTLLKYIHNLEKYKYNSATSALKINNYNTFQEVPSVVESKKLKNETMTPKKVGFLSNDENSYYEPSYYKKKTNESLYYDANTSALDTSNLNSSNWNGTLLKDEEEEEDKKIEEEEEDEQNDYQKDSVQEDEFKEKIPSPKKNSPIKKSNDDKNKLEDIRNALSNFWNRSQLASDYKNDALVDEFNQYAANNLNIDPNMNPKRRNNIIRQNFIEYKIKNDNRSSKKSNNRFDNNRSLDQDNEQQQGGKRKIYNKFKKSKNKAYNKNWKFKRFF
jgi:hypothetical protein